MTSIHSNIFIIRTPPLDHIEYPQVLKASQEIEKICISINERKKQAEKMIEVLRVQRSLSGDFKVIRYAYSIERFFHHLPSFILTLLNIIRVWLDHRGNL